MDTRTVRPVRVAVAVSPHPTLAALLAEPDLRLHLVSAGAGRVDAPVRWVHSTELIDPSRYLRGGELVCTVGATLLDDAACARFVDALVATGATGLCFGLRDVHRRTPAAIVDACATAGLPLVEVPHGVRFLQLSETLAAHRLRVEASRSHRSARLFAALVAAVRDRTPMPDLVAMVAADVGGRVDVEVGGAVLTSGSGPASRASGHRAAGATCEVRWSGGADDEAPSAELLEQVARIVDLVHDEARADLGRRRDQAGALFGLVADAVADVAALYPLLAAAGLDTGRVLVSAWPATVVGLIDAQLPDALLASGPDVVWAVTRSADQVELAAQALGLACGYGSVVGPADLRRGIGEARACLELARRTGGVVGPGALTSLEGLLEQQPAGRLAPFADQLVVPLAEHDARRRTQLLTTLRTFLDHDGSLQGTARAQFLHVNTVRHRLARIRELTGADPLTFDGRTALTIGLWTHERVQSPG